MDTAGSHGKAVLVGVLLTKLFNKAFRAYLHARRLLISSGSKPHAAPALIPMHLDIDSQHLRARPRIPVQTACVQLYEEVLQ